LITAGKGLLGGLWSFQRKKNQSPGGMFKGNYEELNVEIRIGESFIQVAMPIPILNHPPLFAAN
jgi:hypothetical protein